MGRGGFGKVWKVYYKQTKTLYAMKEMNKAKIIDKKSEKSVKSERDLLSKLNHPFIINMHFSFQDNDNLYLVMDLLSGGDLRYHLCKKRFFSEEQTKFILSCIILGLEYCHSNSIIHRDIKPENLVLDSEGYTHITDFGIAKIQQPNNHKETSGTPGYMSPEVLCGQNHTIVVDYFALGVMGYEFMLGVRPYLGKSRKEIKEKVMAKQVLLKKNDIKENWTIESGDFINRLLQRKPSHRLGLHGATEVKEHIWFKNYPWSDLYHRKLISPFIPPNEDNFDYKYCNNMEKQGLKTKERYAEIIISDNYKTVFNNYLYFNRFDKSTYDNKLTFLNIHEKMYKINKPHNRNLSVATNFSNYHRLSNGDNNNKNQDERNTDSGKVLINHGRALSAMGVKCNKAFFDANNYIKIRKYVKKKEILNAKLQKGKNNSKNSLYSELMGNNLTNVNSVAKNNITSSANVNLEKIDNSEPPGKEKENYSTVNFPLNNNTNK